MNAPVQERQPMIGRSLRRREDERLLRGRGRYVDDLGEAGDLRAMFVRSPHAHARIRAIDISRAAAAPGVRAVFTGAELLADGVKGLPCGWRLTSRDGSAMAEPPYLPLCVDAVRHAGDPVAVVIADGLAAARDAAELVAVDYELLPAVVDVRDAAAQGAPRIWDAAPGNLCADWELGDRTAAAAALAGAAHVVELDLVNNRLAPNPMEPRAARALVERATGRTTLYTTSQAPHAVKGMLCATVLGIPESDLRVVAPDVGGGFGAKMFLYPEECVVTWAARRLGAPVRWAADRGESFLTDAHGRDHCTRARLALDPEGNFLALHVETDANVGAYLSQAATAIPTYYYASLLSGVYRIPAIYCNVRLVFTNTPPVDAYRGAGRPEATYLLERLVEEAAWRLGRDPAGLRRQNFIATESYPYETPIGLTYDIGDHHATLDLALDAIDYGGFAMRRAESERRGRLRGIGLSTYVEIAGGLPQREAAKLGWRGARFEAAEIRIQPSGKVTVYCGTHSQGQGHETVFAQIVSDRLGVPYEDVRIVQGDTDLLVHGRGAYASRSLVVGRSAILAAADNVIDKGRRVAAHVFDVGSEQVAFGDGVFTVPGTNHRLTMAEMITQSWAATEFPSDELEPGINESAFYDPRNWTYPGGCHACEVEIDPETGTVELLRVVAADDVGRVINPMVVEGQIHGGLAQGIGQALLEHAVFDSSSGQLLAGSFMDYAMPRAHDLPGFAVLTHETLCTHNALGAKGCAEVGTVGVPPAVINAIIHALRPLGVKHIDMPATPLRVWQAIAEARRSAAPGRP